MIFFKKIQPIQVATTDKNKEIWARPTAKEVPATAAAEVFAIIIGSEATDPMTSPIHFFLVITSDKKKNAKSAVINGEILYIKATYDPDR